MVRLDKMSKNHYFDPKISWKGQKQGLAYTLKVLDHVDHWDTTIWCHFFPFTHIEKYYFEAFDQKVQKCNKKSKVLSVPYLTCNNSLEKVDSQ